MSRNVNRPNGGAVGNRPGLCLYWRSDALAGGVSPRAVVPHGGLRLGLTLIEVLLSMALLGTIVTIAYMTFATAVRSWRAGNRLADHLNHADYTIEQLVMGLRSAYYADTGRVEARYGFVHEPGEAGGYPADRFSWVKLGGALVGGDPLLSGTPHRVEVFVDPPTGLSQELADGLTHGLGVRAWRIDAQAVDFDPDSVEAVFLSPRILGLQCRMAESEALTAMDPGEIEWLDEWDAAVTNRLPRAVELTLFIEPARPDGEPLEVRRIVQLPMAERAWNPVQRQADRVQQTRRRRPPPSRRERAPESRPPTRQPLVPDRRSPTGGGAP